MNDLDDGVEYTLSDFTYGTNWEEWLISHRVVLLFRVTSKGWRNEIDRKLMELDKDKY